MHLGKVPLYHWAIPAKPVSISLWFLQNHRNIRNRPSLEIKNETYRVCPFSIYCTKRIGNKQDIRKETKERRTGLTERIGSCIVRMYDQNPFLVKKKNRFSLYKKVKPIFTIRLGLYFFVLSMNYQDIQKFIYHGEFDPGSGWTLAACFTHASWTRIQ